jgi:MtN3 and saliva related transmembrane protein
MERALFKNMSSLSILATVTGVTMALSGLPQIIKIYKRKSAKDISPVTYLVGVFGTIIWIFYGVELKNLAIVLPNILGMITSTVILIEYYFYGGVIKRSRS